MSKVDYSPPWRNTNIVGIAGSSGSGKTSLALSIVSALNLPWVVILSMDSFYKVLTSEQSRLAFESEYDFDAPDAIDFDLLLECLQMLKEGKKTEVPIYSFEKHARIEKTTTIYSPHVIILEGIFALHDPRILEMLDLKVFTDADPDVCLARRLVRDIRERGRDLEGAIKQWMSFVKPNYHHYVEWQREVADIIVPRGIQNKMAIELVTDHVRKTLKEKSRSHREQLRELESCSLDTPLPPRVIVLEQRPQVAGVQTILLDPSTDREDFIFYMDRLASMLIERATELTTFERATVLTPVGKPYNGLSPRGTISAVSLLRGGGVFERALRRVIPDCITGKVLIQTNSTTNEPALHFHSLHPNLAAHSRVLLLDPQMSSGGAALMAVKILIDHGVQEGRIIFVTYFAGHKGLRRLMTVFPDITVVVCRIGADLQERWIEAKYLGC